MKRAAIFSGIIVWVAVFLVPAAAQGAFGISPPFMHAVHLVPGSKYLQTVYLVQDRPEQDLLIKATLDINERIRPWVSLDRGFEFTIPKGVNQYPVQVVIDVPKSAELASYRGNIVFLSAPSQSGQVTIALGAQVVMNVIVGNDVFEQFTVPVIRLLDVEEGWDPRVYVKFQNDGNIPESFTHATYELLDQYGAVRLAYVQKNDGFPETAPFTVGEYTVEFPVGFHLGLGEYWGKVDFFQNDKLVASQKTVFNVLKSGSLSGPGARIVQIIQKNWMFGAGGLVVLLAGYVIWRRYRRSRAAG